jgi:hypothetical protein
MKVHLLSQYIWPDGSPTCIYTENLAEDLADQGLQVVFVGGKGRFRASSRAKPDNVQIHELNSLVLTRGNLLSIFCEYLSYIWYAARYLRARVDKTDAVIVTSAPFFSLILRYFIPSGALKIYWLFDYFPPALSIIFRLPLLIKRVADSLWSYELSKWDRVIKIAGNLGYHGDNQIVQRLWPTIHISEGVIEESDDTAKSALYAGNLSLIHDVPMLVQKCRELRDNGYRILFSADGPGVKKLPEWIEKRSTGIDDLRFAKLLAEHSIHLIVGTPRLEDYCFPSKIWNSLAVNRKVVACAMSKEMLREFEECLASPFREHRGSMLRVVLDLLEKDKDFKAHRQSV